MLAAALLAAVVAAPGPVSAQADERPASVTGVIAHPGDSPGELAVSWDAHPGRPRDGYRVAVAPVGGSYVGGEFGGKLGGPTSNTFAHGTSATIEGLIPGGEYKVIVRARFGPGIKNSEWSEEATGFAGGASAYAPSELVAEAQADGVRLSWAAPETDAGSVTGYRIERRRADGTSGPQSQLEADTGTAATSYVDESVAVGGAYTYRVRALRGTQLSHTSNEATVAYEPADPAALAPTGLALEASAQGVVLRWQPPASRAGEVTGYEVWRSPTPTGDDEMRLFHLLSPWHPNFTDTTSNVEGRRFEYGVRAVRGSEKSALSDIAALVYRASAVDPAAARDMAPSGLTAVEQADRVRLDWLPPVMDPGSVTAYSVERTAVRGGDSGRRVSAFGGRATTWDDAGPKVAGAVYRYRVRALRGNVFGGWSEPVEVAWKDASLGSLAVDGVVLSPAFDSGIELYSGTHTGTARHITVTASATSASASVQIAPADADTSVPGHQVALSANGNTTINITVEASDGAARRSYWVVVSGAAAAGDPSSGLDGLQMSGVDGFAFEEDQTRYDAEAPAGLAETTVAASGVDADATVEVFVVRADGGRLRADTHDADDSADGHQAALSDEGDTLVIVVVTSGDGRLQRAYITRIRRAPGHQPAVPPARSKSVAAPRSYSPPVAKWGGESEGPPTLTALRVGDARLVPRFNPGTFEYKAAVGSNTSQVTVIAAADAEDAEVMIIPEEDADPDTPGHQVDLRGYGTETVIMVILKEDGAELDSYTVTVARADGADTSLKSLKIDGRVLEPEFSPDTSDYAVEVPSYIATLDLRAAAADPDAAVTVSEADANALVDGYQIILDPVTDKNPSTKTITVTVESADETDDSSSDYTIAVTRAELSSGAGFKYIETGWDFACAIRMDGTLTCWGYDHDVGGARNFDGVEREMADFLASLGVVQQVTASIFSLCAVRPDGETRCWYRPSSWQEDGPDPIQLGGTGPAVDEPGTAGPLVHRYTLYAGCRLQADRSADCPGAQPPQSLRAGPYQAIAAGSIFGCGLTDDGRIKCWMDGYEFDMPNPDVEYKRIAAGGISVCGIRADDSTLDCWRLLAYPPSSRRRLPQPAAHPNTPPDEFHMVDMAYGEGVCGLKTDGTVTCWKGAVGFWGADWPTWLIQRGAPDATTLGYTMISMDRYPFACGLRTDSSIACWGYDNDYIGSRLPEMESPWLGSADLLALKTSGGAPSPGFDPETVSYSLEVPHGTDSIALQPEATNLFAAYAITADTDSDVEDDVVDLSVGANTITITVTAADRVTVKAYTLTVTRQTATP